MCSVQWTLFQNLPQLVAGLLRLLSDYIERDYYLYSRIKVHVGDVAVECVGEGA